MVPKIGLSCVCLITEMKPRKTESGATVKATQLPAVFLIHANP